jgi:ABC-type lipoprotein release transport system permease subunit
MIQKAFLLLTELFKSRFISLIVLFSIIVSVISVALFTVIGNNFNSYIRNRFVSSIPPNTIKVLPKPKETVLFFGTGRRKGPELTGKALRKIRALKGIKNVNPVMLTRVPVQARISMFGITYKTDILCMGVPYRFISGDFSHGKFKKMWRSHDPEKNIPVLFPRILINAYNRGMAEPNMLPKISEKMVSGMRFKLLFGYSSLRKMDNFIQVDATVSGFTDKINSLAMVVPLKAAAHYNRVLHPESKRDSYLHAFVTVADHSSLLRVSSIVKKMGFVVEAEKKLSREMLRLRRNVNLVIDLLMYLIVALSVLTISFSTMIATMNRIEYYRILRILGASRNFISLSIITRYILLGIGGTFLGLQLIELLSEAVTGMINISFIRISLLFTEDIKDRLYLYGVLIPVLSTLPAIIRLNTKGLSRD